MGLVQQEYKKIDTIYRAAMGCRKCFKRGYVQPAFINLPSPRWIGPDYWSSSQKILLLLVNPGAGNSRTARKGNEDLKKTLVDYKNGKVGLLQLLQDQKKRIEKWGVPPGRFCQFYIDGLGLKLETIAVANIASCSDALNKHPPEMLKLCFDLHTSKLIEAISPDVILLSGGSTHHFYPDIQSIRQKPL